MDKDQLEEMKKNTEKYLNFLLQILVDNEGSDLYLIANEYPAVRVNDGVVKLRKLDKLEPDLMQWLAYWMMTDIQWEAFRVTQNLDLGFAYNGRRFRVNISMQKNTVMIVFRLLGEKIPTIDDLKLPIVFKKLIAKKSWIIFVTWPTGSGKTSTLSAMIEEVNMNYAKNIITIEDPIEYEYHAKKSLIEQKELGKDVPNYATALMWAMRQRPDIILVWEARDAESISSVITLAETWHLVFTTLHTKSAPQTINRIIDSFPTDQQNQVRVQLADTLWAIIAQRLIKKEWWGMIAAFEILICSPAVSNLIRENQIAGIYNVMQTSRGVGMISLEDYLLSLIRKRLISVEDAFFFANRTEYMQNELGV